MITASGETRLRVLRSLDYNCYFIGRTDDERLEYGCKSDWNVPFDGEACIVVSLDGHWVGVCRSCFSRLSAPESQSKRQKLKEFRDRQLKMPWGE